jgi:hypothetical protein
MEVQDASVLGGQSHGASSLERRRGLVGREILSLLT